MLEKAQPTCVWRESDTCFAASNLTSKSSRTS